VADLPARSELVGRPVGRRVLLGVLGLGALGVVVGERLEGVAQDLLRPLRQAGLAGVLPGAGGFTLYTVTGGFPAPPPHERLVVDGLVRRHLALRLDDLATFPRTQLVETFQCVTGWRVPGARWAGVRLATLLAAAGPLPQASALRFFSFDGVYTESLTLDQVARTGALVATSLWDRPLSRPHGGPVRLVVPDMYGYKSIKWLARIEVTDRLVPGYWEQRGYPSDAWIGGRAPTASTRGG
jgi:DMSO/TMAO reductase YedYZ molybdopterin-dependent catalytic subunit